MELIDKLGNKVKKGFGFTLVELLTSISIIALLAALAVPGISWARYPMVKAACKKNQRAFYDTTAIALQEFSPYKDLKGKNRSFEEHLVSKHLSYKPDDFMHEPHYRIKQMTCPDVPRKDITAPMYDFFTTPDKVLWATYDYTYWFTLKVNDPSLAELPVIHDNYPKQEQGYLNLDRFNIADKRILIIQRDILHKGRGSNWTYADGHTEWVRNQRYDPIN